MNRRMGTWRMESDGELRMILVRVRAIARRKERTLDWLRRQMGWSPEELEEFFARPRELTFETLYGVLDVLEVPRDEFFAEQFPAPTGPPQPAADERRGEERGTPQNEVAADLRRILEHLKAVALGDKRRTQKELARRLDWSEGRLSNLFNGKAVLHWVQIEAILGVAGMSTAEFHRQLWFDDEREETRR